MLLASLLGVVPSLPAQELGGAGTIQGTVKDPTGAVMQAVRVDISNPVSGFRARPSPTQMADMSFGTWRRTGITSASKHRAFNGSSGTSRCEPRCQSTLI